MPSCCQGSHPTPTPGVIQPKTNTFPVKVSFNESDFVEIATYYGSRNDSPIELLGTIYAAYSLTFDNVRCALDTKTMKYVGWIDFLPVRSSEEEKTSNFTRLVSILDIG